MALSKSLLKAQIAVGCQLCETEARITSKCKDCYLFICETCEKLHKKLAKDHKIVDIESIQLPSHCQLCENAGANIQWWCNGCDMHICDTCKKVHLKLSKGHSIIKINSTGETKVVKEHAKSKIGFNLKKKYIVVTQYIHHMAVCSDKSLWISDSKLEKLQHIRLSGETVTVLSTFNIKPYSLAISPSGFPFIVVNETSTIKVINEITGNIEDSQYSIHPWILSCTYVNKNGDIFVGGHDGIRGVVIVMDQNGTKLMKYEQHKDKAIFTYPRRICTTACGNVLILDGKYSTKRGRLVIIEQGDVIQFYNGHPEINNENKPFNPTGIVVTHRDNVLIVDKSTKYFQILNNKGDYMTYYNPGDIGVIRPYSVTLTSSGKIYVGSAGLRNDQNNTTQILYKLKCSGF